MSDRFDIQLLPNLRGVSPLAEVYREWISLEAFKQAMLQREADAVRPWWAEKQTNSDGETVWVERKSN